MLRVLRYGRAGDITPMIWHSFLRRLGISRTPNLALDAASLLHQADAALADLKIGPYFDASRKSIQQQFRLFSQ